MHKGFLQYIFGAFYSIFAERRCLMCRSVFSVVGVSEAEKGGSVHLANELSLRFPQTARNEHHTIQNISDLLIDFLAKSFCPDCVQDFHIKAKGYCPLCAEFFDDKNMTPNLCASCATKTPMWKTFVFVDEYSEKIREIIYKAKFTSSTTNLRFIGSLLAFMFALHVLQDEKMLKKTFYLMPVPLHQKRLAERGYNQCLEMAKYFMKMWVRLQKNIHQNTYLPQIILDTESLERKNYSHAQSLLPKTLRKENVVNCFYAQNCQGKHIILFDDIATTNATLHEVCKVLNHAGAEEIHCMVFTKGRAKKNKG